MKTGRIYWAIGFAWETAGSLLFGFNFFFAFNQLFL